MRSQDFPGHGGSVAFLAVCHLRDQPIGFVC